MNGDMLWGYMDINIPCSFVNTNYYNGGKFNAQVMVGKIDVEGVGVSTIEGIYFPQLYILDKSRTHPLFIADVPAPVIVGRDLAEELTIQEMLMLKCEGSRLQHQDPTVGVEVASTLAQCRNQGQALAVVTRNQKQKMLQEEKCDKVQLPPLPGVSIANQSGWHQKLLKEQLGDEELATIIERIREGTVMSDFELRGGILYHIPKPSKTTEGNRGSVRRQICVPKSLLKEVLTNCHDSILGGHYGVKKTLHLIRST